MFRLSLGFQQLQATSFHGSCWLEVLSFFMGCEGFLRMLGVVQQPRPAEGSGPGLLRATDIVGCGVSGQCSGWSRELSHELQALLHRSIRFRLLWCILVTESYYPVTGSRFSCHWFKSHPKLAEACLIPPTPQCRSWEPPPDGFVPGEDP